MRKYITLTIISLGIAAYCWAAAEATYRYPVKGTLPGPTLIILVGEDVSFEEAMALRRRNAALEQELAAAREEIERLQGRISRAADDLEIVTDFLRATAPATAGTQSETPTRDPMIEGPGWKIYREGDRVFLDEKTVLHW